jgi:hypothetical protein
MIVGVYFVVALLHQFQQNLHQPELVHIEV